MLSERLPHTTLLQNLLSLEWNLVHADEFLGETNEFSHLDGYIPTVSHVSAKVLFRQVNFREAFITLGYSSLDRDIH